MAGQLVVHVPGAEGWSEVLEANAVCGESLRAIARGRARGQARPPEREACNQNANDINVFRARACAIARGLSSQSALHQTEAEVTTPLIPPVDMARRVPLPKTSSGLDRRHVRHQASSPDLTHSATDTPLAVISQPSRVADPGEGIGPDELGLAARNPACRSRRCARTSRHGAALPAHPLRHPVVDPATWRLEVAGSSSSRCPCPSKTSARVRRHPR